MQNERDQLSKLTFYSWKTQCFKETCKSWSPIYCQHLN